MDKSYLFSIITALFVFNIAANPLSDKHYMAKAAKGSKATTTASEDAPDGMVYVKGGTFWMGSNHGDFDSKPVHRVILDDFYIDKHEVTTEEFCKFLNEKGNQEEGGSRWVDIDDIDCPVTVNRGRFKVKPGKAKHPMIEVTWYAARAYAKWKGKRLPTEAEWEYAAKGGQKARETEYSGSNNPTEVAWYDANANGRTHEVGELNPNELGIYDMSGNVWEWCRDWYQADYYEKAPLRNPKGPQDQLNYKLLRGGAWVSIDEQVTTTMRDYAYPYNAYYLNGFRCVKDAE